MDGIALSRTFKRYAIGGSEEASVASSWTRRIGATTRLSAGKGKSRSRGYSGTGEPQSVMGFHCLCFQYIKRPESNKEKQKEKSGKK
jgi:hypothetical protein